MNGTRIETYVLSHIWSIKIIKHLKLEAKKSQEGLNVTYHTSCYYTRNTIELLNLERRNYRSNTTINAAFKTSIAVRAFQGDGLHLSIARTL